MGWPQGVPRAENSCLGSLDSLVRLTTWSGLGTTQQWVGLGISFPAWWDNAMGPKSGKNALVLLCKQEKP